MRITFNTDQEWEFSSGPPYPAGHNVKLLIRTVLCIFIYSGSINHNKVLDFITLDNYTANSQSFQLHWSLDHYKTALDDVSVILEGLVAVRLWSWNLCEFAL